MANQPLPDFIGDKHAVTQYCQPVVRAELRPCPCCEGQGEHEQACTFHDDDPVEACRLDGEWLTEITLLDRIAELEAGVQDLRDVLQTVMSGADGSDFQLGLDALAATEHLVATSPPPKGAP